jgi:hypothetical protein
MGIALWFLGRQTSNIASEHEIKFIRQLNNGYVYLPIWLYWLCGKPHSENLPRGVVSARALMSQLSGILFLVYGCYYEYSNKPAEISSPESIIMPLILGIGLGYLLKKIRPFQP